MNASDSDLELSKKVHGLLDHIRNLQYKNEISESTILEDPDQSFIVDKPEEVILESELISADDINFSDDERWLYVPNGETTTSDLTDWLLDKNGASQSYGLNLSNDSKKFVDTRTFTRPKKRITRPSLENRTTYAGLYTVSDHEKNISNSSVGSASSDNNATKESSFNVAHSEETIDKDNHTLSSPLHFKLSEPVLNNTFDKILATGKECIDSFQNMSPPSLMNSLCSSSFTTLMDSSYVNNLDQISMPGDFNETFNLTAEISQEIENLNHITRSYQDAESPPINKTQEVSINATFDGTKIIICDNGSNESLTEKCSNSPLNATFDKRKRSLSKLVAPKSTANSTFNKSIVNDDSKTISKSDSLDTTYQKVAHSNIKNISNTNTFIRKPKTNSYSNLKSSCPDINKTFQRRTEESLNRTFQKLSDSQPNLTSSVQQTILNQTMDLMDPAERFHNSKSGSADSLDERSSSISTSSRGSESRIMNMSDLDNLARLQEQSLRQLISTPKQMKNLGLLWEGDVPSPIGNAVDDYLSDSDSDVCVTARSRQSASHSLKGKISLANANRTHVLPDKPKGPPEVSQSSQRTLPTMIVKPMEVKQIPQPAQSTVRPRLRGSGLPRPTSASTGIPRPTSRIPGPKSFRPQLVRPAQRQLPKSDWMDGCY